MGLIGAEMRIWLVRTDLDFIEVFMCDHPRRHAKTGEWQDYGRIYVFGRLYWALNALRLRGVLLPNVPRSFALGQVDGANAVFRRNRADHLELWVRPWWWLWQPFLLETYCLKTMRAFRMHHLPVGTPIGLRIEPYVPRHEVHEVGEVEHMPMDSGVPT
jgi:hypothetical protein